MVHIVYFSDVRVGMKCCFVILALTAGAQSPPLSYDVASIRLSALGSTGRSANFPKGGLRIKGATLKFLIARAYDLMEFQVTGGAGWIGTERYDIMAKSDDTDFDPGERRNRERMQTLLADRFQLKVHRDTKELGIYSLMLVKDGPKLKESEEDKPGQMMSQPGMLRGMRVGMPLLIIALSNSLERTVLDETGLKGRYDFQVEWTPDQTVAAADDLSRPGSIFTAVQEKLGLKLQSRKGPVSVIVVDGAERASGN